MFEKARDEQNAWGAGHRYWTMVFEPLGKRTWTLGIQEGQSPREVSPGGGQGHVSNNTALGATRPGPEAELGDPGPLAYGWP